jgi:hypothetical protein
VFELCCISNNVYSLFDSRALTARPMEDNEARRVSRFQKVQSCKICSAQCFRALGSTRYCIIAKG